MRGGLFMVVNAVGAVVGASLGVQFGHVVNVLLGEAAAVINGGKFCRQWSEAQMLQSADVVAGLCGLTFRMCTGVAFHGFDLWVEFTGLEGQSGNAVLTAIGRNYVNGAERVDLNDGANLAVDRDGLAEGGFRGIHVMFLRVGLTDEKGKV